MGRMATRGQPVALAAIRGMIENGTPHALLLAGPSAVGKTTLALDLAASLLCLAPEPADRPCRSCRGCRLVASGNHPDLHRVAPEGPGGQVRIDAVRDLVSRLALLPVEGGARVAVIEGAHRLNEDAQNALLKTLEEPPSGVVLVLCADDEDRLLPTIRSRCARIRLGTVAGRDIEAWLRERDAADPATAARLARLADGRPGIALAYASSPEALAARTEIDRTLIDLLAAGPSGRLVAVRGLLAVARVLVRGLDAATTTRDHGADEGAAPVRRTRGRIGPSPARGGGTVDDPAEVSPAPSTAGDAEAADSGVEGGAKASPAERRRAAAQLVDIWRDLTLDLARAGQGDRRRLHDPGLLEEIDAAAMTVPAGAITRFLARLARIDEVLDGNANPELAIDVLALAWPRVAPIAR
jgi:DNA polymerase III delta' subunit